jgi:MFS family permease
MTQPLEPAKFTSADRANKEANPQRVTGQPSAAPTLLRPVEGTFRSLRHRNFQLYFGGQLVSVAGTWMQAVAQAWLVYEISHSELTLGIVGFASAIPALLVLPWGGVIVDRVPKRALLIVTQASAMLLALILAVLAFTHTVQVWHVVALAAGLGLVNAFDAPARQAFVVDMVGREDMTNAIALNSMMFNSARVIGPAIGGLLLASVGSAWCFLLNGLSYLAVIAGLWAMQLPPQTARRAVAAPLKELSSGLKYVWHQVDLFALLLIALIFAVFGLSYSTVLPAFADQVLHSGASGYGLLNAATGLGAVAGALIIARTGGGGRRGRLLIIVSLAFPIVLLAFAFVGVFGIALLLASALGLLFMVQFTLINTLLQLHVADEMRGRVLSLYSLTFFGFAPFGNLATGNLSEYWGLSLTIGLSATVALLLFLAVIAVVPRLRHLH